MRIWANTKSPYDRVRSEKCPGENYLLVGKVMYYTIPVEIVVDPDQPLCCSMECDAMDTPLSDEPPRPPKCNYYGPIEASLFVDEGDNVWRCAGCLAEKIEDVTR